VLATTFLEGLVSAQLQSGHGQHAVSQESERYTITLVACKE